MDAARSCTIRQSGLSMDWLRGRSVTRLIRIQIGTLFVLRSFECFVYARSISIPGGSNPCKILENRSLLLFKL